MARAALAGAGAGPAPDRHGCGQPVISTPPLPNTSNFRKLMASVVPTALVNAQPWSLLSPPVREAHYGVLRQMLQAANRVKTGNMRGRTAVGRLASRATIRCAHETGRTMRRLARRRRGIRAPRRRRRAVRYAGAVQPHLDPAQRAAQHQVVEMAEMADAEDLALQPAEAGAERHVEAVEDDLAQPVGIVPVGHHDRGQRIRILARIGAQHLEAPAGDRAPRRLGVPGVAARRPLAAPPRRAASSSASRSPNSRLVAGV